MEEFDLYTEMYAKLPNLILAFHGCNSETYNNVIKNNQPLNKSLNRYDWLGNGIYFWENSYQRAFEWAQSHYPKNPAVVGAVIDLGNCLNLTDYKSCEILKLGYELLVSDYRNAGKELPKNKRIKSSRDVLLRDLNCAVIQEIHQFNKEHKLPEYDSVRGLFFEGEPVFPGSCIYEKTHVQVCVTNPNCIKGYFTPLKKDSEYIIP